MIRPWRRPPNVALFTDTYDEISGVGNTFRRLAAWCESRGLPLHVYTVAPDQSSREERGSVVIHRVRPRIPFNYYPGLYLDLVPLDDTAVTTARAGGFNVVHVATPGHIGITGLYLASKLSVPLIGSYHTEFPEYISQRLVTRFDSFLDQDQDAIHYVRDVSQRLAWDYLACFYNHCAKVLVPSESTREQILERLRPPLELFRRGVDTEGFSPAHRRRPDEQRVRCLYVGRLAVEKNLVWLVDAARRLPDLEWYVVGDGPQRAELQVALPDAVFTGTLHDEALAEAYASADLFAFPSRSETFGNVVLEAQASGLPAVVSDAGGPREIIEPGRTGLVAATAEEFASHLLALARDPERRRSYARAARLRAEQHDWESVFERLYSQYRSVLHPWNRRVWRSFLQRMRDSDHPFAVGLVAFWKQFGRRREAQAARRLRERGLGPTEEAGP
ncbi:MAG: glycosyltransferase family 1 protein [Armatimonadetes bacterium]|nr:glycosyltransferase family 1 protein [Armatimonadota bacterium]